MCYKEVPEHRKEDVMWMIEEPCAVELFFSKFKYEGFALTFFDLGVSTCRVEIVGIPVDKYAEVVHQICAFDAKGPIRWIRTDRLYREYYVGVDMSGCHLRGKYRYQNGLLISG